MNTPEYTVKMISRKSVVLDGQPHINLQYFQLFSVKFYSGQKVSIKTYFDGQVKLYSKVGLCVVKNHSPLCIATTGYSLLMWIEAACVEGRGQTTE